MIYLCVELRQQQKLPLYLPLNWQHLDVFVALRFRNFSGNGFELSRAFPPFVYVQLKRRLKIFYATRRVVAVVFVIQLLFTSSLVMT